ncbi:hypothetical protein BGZ65_007492, partial [Modicella reniformis]
FRETFDWFPKEIYYSATFQEKKLYNAKYFGEDNTDATGNGEEGSGQDLPAKRSQVNGERHLEQQTTIRELKSEVLWSQQQMNELKDQLTKQQLSFEEQMQHSQMQLNMLHGMIRQQFAEMKQVLSAAPAAQSESVPNPSSEGGGVFEQDEDDT